MEQNVKVYISVPLTVDREIVANVIELIEKAGGKADWWQRGTHYTHTKLKESDAIVVILPKLEFSMYLNDIPLGTQSEIKLAIQLQKPVYLGYSATENGLGIYTAGVNSSGTFRGSGGTRSYLADYIKTVKEQRKQKELQVTLNKEAEEDFQTGIPKELQGQFISVEHYGMWIQKNKGKKLTDWGEVIFKSYEERKEDLLKVGLSKDLYNNFCYFHFRLKQKSPQLLSQFESELLTSLNERLNKFKDVKITQQNERSKLEQIQSERQIRNKEGINEYGEPINPVTRGGWSNSVIQAVNLPKADVLIDLYRNTGLMFMDETTHEPIPIYFKGLTIEENKIALLLLM